jgi:uncharacterized protein
MPETVELKELVVRRGRLDDRRRDLRVKVDDLTRDQTKADQDVEQVRLRRRRDQERMDQGLVGSAKDLERMQHELVSLERRINELEDVELEVMQQLETAQHELTEVVGQLESLDQKAAALTVARDERAGDLRAEGAKVTSQRGAAAEGMPAELMALYTRLCEQKSGVGAAALRQRRCGGCSLELNAADLGAIKAKPSDEVVRCEECGRILVRTPEPGL